MKILGLLFTIFLLEIVAEHKHGPNCTILQLYKMKTAGIIPDVIDNIPSNILEVTYNKKVEFGNELLPEDVIHKPQLKWEAEEGVHYTLVMVDPDAPSRKAPALRNFNHWLVTNILKNDVAKGEQIVGFIGSLPANNTKLHRYTFLIFKQPKKFKFDEHKTSGYTCKNRLSFDVKNFAKKYHLGRALAGNFYNCQWGQYVDTIKMKHCTTPEEDNMHS